MNDLLLTNPNLVISLFAVAVGLSVALVTWLLTRTVSEVPKEDRAYKDPPPLGFRLLWYPIHWYAYFGGRFMSQRSRTKTAAQLRKAGLEYSLTPEQFVAGRIVAGLVCALFARWLVGSFDNPAEGEAGFSDAAYQLAYFAGMVFGMYYPVIWLRDQLAKRRSELLKTLPFYLDIITLCVEAGLNMQGAMGQAVAKGPSGVLRDEIQRVLRDIRAGKSRAASLRVMAERLNEPTISSFTSAVIQAEAMGMNLGPVLRAQADQRRSERFLRAEKLAMEAPVKMLAPLIMFIFPCTFVVLFFPIAMKFMHSGI